MSEYIQHKGDVHDDLSYIVSCIVSQLQHKPCIYYTCVKLKAGAGMLSRSQIHSQT